MHRNWVHVQSSYVVGFRFVWLELWDLLITKRTQKRRTYLNSNIIIIGDQKHIGGCLDD